MTSLLIGVAGAFLGGFIGRALGMYSAGESTGGFVMSLLGAIVLVGIYQMVAKASHTPLVWRWAEPLPFHAARPKRESAALAKDSSLVVPSLAWGDAPRSPSRQQHLAPTLRRSWLAFAWVAVLLGGCSMDFDWFAPEEPSGQDASPKSVYPSPSPARDGGRPLSPTGALQSVGLRWCLESCVSECDAKKLICDLGCGSRDPRAARAVKMPGLLPRLLRLGVSVVRDGAACNASLLSTYCRPAAR